MTGPAIGDPRSGFLPVAQSEVPGMHLGAERLTQMALVTVAAPMAQGAIIGVLGHAMGLTPGGIVEGGRWILQMTALASGFDPFLGWLVLHDLGVTIEAGTTSLQVPLVGKFKGQFRWMAPPGLGFLGIGVTLTAILFILHVVAIAASLLGRQE